MRRLGELEHAETGPGAQEAILARLAALRKAAAGEVAGAEGVDAVRMQLAALFDRFEIARVGLPADPALPPAMVAARDQALAEIRSEGVEGRWVIVPWPKVGALDPALEWVPVLRDNDTAGEPLESLSWRPFRA